MKKWVLVGLVVLFSAASRAEEPPGEDSAKKWKSRGVEDPVELEMMRIWDSKDFARPDSVEEWSINYSPSRGFAYVYFLYNDGAGPTTLTYFRIKDSKPEFLRHDVWPEMVYFEVNEEGQALILEFNHAALAWSVTDLAGKRWSGMLMDVMPGTSVENDGSFTISTRIADYRLMVSEGKAELSLKKFCSEATFIARTFTEPSSYLPAGISREQAAQLAENLAELRAKAEEVLEEEPENPTAKYVRIYAICAVPILKDPKHPCGAKEPINLPNVETLLDAIVEGR